MTSLLHAPVLAAMNAHGASIAVEQDGVATTYAALAEHTHRVAALVAALCGPEDRLVGVSASVTTSSVATILGVLAAGRAYVPLDVQSPPARLREIVADARLKVLCVDPMAYPDWRTLLDGAGLESLVLIDADPPDDVPQRPRVLGRTDVARADATPHTTRGTLADDLAYVLYTSGSTGVPKGVMLTHRNARTFVDWMAKEFQIASQDRVASRAPLNFDLSVFDVFNTLAAGATLLIKDRRRGVEGDARADGRHRDYVALLRDRRASVLYTTPSTLITLLEKGGLDHTVPLRLVLYAGEPFPPMLLRRLMLALPATRVANIYGPTETNIVTYHWVDQPPSGDVPIPIGREVDDTEIVIVDDGRRCGPDTPGEIWVRGGTVCLGYLRQDALTRERLVDSPFHAYPAKYWRTGDYGKRLADGTLVYHGRIDNMVKTRGHRVELGDVEAALAGMPALGQAVVVPRPHPSYGSTLHAFVVPRAGAAVTPDDVQRFLADRIPEYMLPREVVVVAELPSTSSGKVDRQQLIRSLAR